MKEKNCYNPSKNIINETKVKDILLVFLVQVMFGLSSFAADPILLNCIETPEIYNLDSKPKNFHSSNNLRRKPGSPGSATGELINIVGRITDINCLPIQNAVVSIWHANSHGVNHYDENVEYDKLDQNFAGSGRFIVNNLGYYNFITVAPGKIGDRAPHINFLVQHPDFPEFTTQMFFTDHNCDNCTDSILGNFIDSGLANLLIAPFTYNDRAIKTYTFNITLGGYNKFSDKR
ncbi:MAG: protocatechuate 3,4-dioxygenase [Wolbachia sp.]